MHHGRSTSLLLLCATAVLMLLAGSARADEPLPKPVVPEAMARFDAGNAAYNQAKDEKDATASRAQYQRAVKEYLAGVALETKYHYTFYWNLGHAYRQLGEFTRADFFYKKFLEFAPARFAQYRGAAEEFQRQMKAELDKETALADKSQPDAPTEPKKPQPPAAGGGEVVAKVSPEVRGAPWHADRLGWVLVGGGALGILGGGGFLLSGSSLYDQAADEDRQSVANDLRARGDRRVLIGGIVGGVGVGLVAVGVIRLALTDDAPTPRPGIQVTVGPTSFSVWGSF